MKKLIISALLIIGVFSLSACDDKGIDKLPDLNGLTIREIEDIFDNSDLVLSVEIDGDDSIIDNQLFKSYGVGMNIGDSINKGDTVYLILYSNILYFETTEMIYDGPTLNMDLFNISAITEHIDNPNSNYDDNIIFDGTGGAFEVTLKYCGDGDTAIFNYPDDIYQAIIDPSKRVRFLNMDTEETYTNNEEEWGKPASVYTCELLTNAESIALQTDPGDELLGNYDRLLAWIWIKLPGEDNYQLLNYIVVKQGLAQVKYEYGAGETIGDDSHTYNEWMHIAEDYAFIHSLGQWGELIDYYWDYENSEPNWEHWNK